MGLSVCQAVKSNAVLHFCVELRCAWAGEPRFKMNQLISKSTSEDINTNLLAAVISTRGERYGAGALHRPSFDWEHGGGKGAAHLNGSHFTNNAITDKHF